MARLVEPGSKVMLNMDHPRSAQVVRLYDPNRLQVRVDIPLVDAAKVGVGKPAEVIVEVLPDKADDGMKVTRKTWSGGKDGSEVVLIEIENGGHTWPGMKPIVAQLGESTMDISANDLMWEFFQKHPMKPETSTKPEPKP